MRTALFILAILFISVQTYAQSTYHIYEYDNITLNPSREHSPDYIRFYKKPTDPGKYIVIMPPDNTNKTSVWGVFYVDKKYGRVIDSTNFCGYIADIDLEDENNISSDSICAEKDVYILNMVQVLGYKENETDTVEVRVFRKNSKFNRLIRKIHVYSRLMGFVLDPLHQSILLHYNALPCSYDYELVMKNGDVFRITRITTALYKAVTPQEDTSDEYTIHRKKIGDFCTMYSYELNGKKVISNFIELIKPGYEKTGTIK